MLKRLKRHRIRWEGKAAEDVVNAGKVTPHIPRSTDIGNLSHSLHILDESVGMESDCDRVRDVAEEVWQGKSWTLEG